MSTLYVKESEHSELGPSSSERWLNCTASVAATKGLKSSSSYAREGTAAHAVAEECFEKNLPPKHFLGWTVEIAGEGETIIVDQEMVDGVETFLEYVADIPGGQICEMRVEYDRYVPGGFGKMDRAVIDGKTLHVIDLKYGKGVPVDAHDNSQLKLYALGLWCTLDWLLDDVDTIVLHVVQPRLDSITQHTLSLNALKLWAQTVAVTARKILENRDLAFKPGDWCTFCKIRTTCKARTAAVLGLVTDEFEDLDAAIEKVGPVDVAAITNEQLSRILPQLKQIKHWVADMERHAMAEIIHGRPVGDYKIVEGISRRAYNGDPETIGKAMMEAGNLLEEDVYERKLIKISDAEKLLGKKHEFFKKYVTKPKGKPTLAPGSDKRPSITVNALDEFDDLDADEG